MTSPSLKNTSRSSSWSSQNTTTINLDEQQLLDDMHTARHALDLFLNSRIVEAEAILRPELCKTSMYYSLGKAVLLSLKSMMTFQASDFEEAIVALKQTVQLANTVARKSQSSESNGWFLEGLTSWIKGGLTIERLENMKPIARHAELIQAEAHLLKAMLCIVHDESLMSFLREGLNIRQSYVAYTVLESFIQQTKMPLDPHFTSGVCFGMGSFKLMLSLLPKTVLRLVEFIGFSGDRTQGMKLLESNGGWDEYKRTGKAPVLQGPDEGLRRQFSDMMLINYHLVIAKLVPVSDADESLASAVLDYNLQLYPNGVIFLFFLGRKLFCETKLDQADEAYTRAINTQKDWIQLQHIGYWERGCISMVRGDWKLAVDIYAILHNESNWSKAVYMYFKGVALFMLAQSESNESKRKDLISQAHDIMKKVPDSRQKIAGKSIPLEKFVARKARKFIDQDDYLLFPDLEVLNAFGISDYIPISLLRTNIQRIDQELNDVTNASADDVCLAYYLRSVMARRLYIRSPDKQEEQQQMRDIHHQSIQNVYKQAQDLVLDHYIYYFSRYEEARMMILDGDYDGAETSINVILKANEKGQYNIGKGSKAKSKYSLENSLLFRCHNCQTEIQALRASCTKRTNSEHSTTSSDSFASATSS
ncbi:hypothetical protein K492DRAFT_211430 [Lichtheimia hyalospora FSU 10163]|nr:hypothetical protein K492DRAFT_211430 [Lichtheimia hyalospora FSU 10163]